MRAQGLSLLELLIVVSIIAVLAATALPGFTSLARRHQAQTTANNLFHAIQLAREQAVSVNRRATIRRLAAWSDGWEVFIDDDGNGMRAGNEHLLLRQDISLPVLIKANAPVSNYVSFTGSGESKTVNGAFLAGTLTVCSEDKSEALAIVISRGGRARIDKANPLTCI